MKKILIIGTGWEQIPLVKKAKQYGLYVIAAAWWDKEQIPADKVYEVDSHNLEALDKIICTENPDYIIADESDSAMYAVAFFAEKYHFYGPKLSTQTITNNKFLQRECVKKTSVLQPAYRMCWNLDMVREFAYEAGYPIIIKPLDNCGSIGISKIHTDSELIAAWLKAVQNSYSRMCIAEKCICGKVITADGFCDSSGFEFITASSKDMYPENETVAKVLYFPGKFSDSMLEKIKEATEQTVNAIEITYGFTHIEFIVEEGSNDIYFIEAANRGGGVFISNIILEEITGIDYCGALLQMAIGKKTYAKCGRQYIKKAILYFLESPEKDSIFNSLDENFPTECRAIHLNKKDDRKNVKNEASAGRHGVAVLAGDSFENLLNIGRSLEKKVSACQQEYFWLRMKR
ncbi:ATP-grasp domain-containing protein [Lachnospiraceae bacterium]|nr:ATP-grasp domain-containing protein [Lachnospiraceae bacterium]